MSNKKKTYPVAPDSVYVWRGFMAPAPHTYPDFASFLGSVFVPACALLQPTAGLRAYVPTMVPQTNKPPAVPDQTALMFWATPQSHDQANQALAGRIYQHLHGDVYDMDRSRLKEVPLPLPATASDFTVEQPYFLSDTPADWMLGSIRHVVGSIPDNTSTETFCNSIYQWAVDFQTKMQPGGIDGALVCCGEGYAVVWIHATTKTASLSGILEGFEKLVKVQLSITPQDKAIHNGLWDNWEGLDLTLPENTSLNFQLHRTAKISLQS